MIKLRKIRENLAEKKKAEKKQYNKKSIKSKYENFKNSNSKIQKYKCMHILEDKKSKFSYREWR